MLEHGIRIISYIFCSTLIILISIGICIDVHELGHYVFGKILGFYASPIAGCLLVIERKKSGWTSHFKNYERFFSGKIWLNTMNVTELEQINPIKLTLFSLGGLIFNILLCYVAITFFTFPYSHWIKVLAVLFFYFALVGDGVRSMMILFSRTYRSAILLLTYMQTNKDTESVQHLLGFLTKEIII